MALAWLDQIGNSPFFLWVHYFDPHMPYAPPGYDAASAIAAPYDAEIAYVDSQLARLLQRSAEIGRVTRSRDSRQGTKTSITRNGGGCLGRG